MDAVRFWDPRREPHGLPHDPFLALVAPRPIGWISTVSAAGVNNLAPYSFFNAFSTRPYIVGFASTGPKDSLANVAETGCFAVNVATDHLRAAMNESSAAVPPEVDEFALAGLTAAPCRSIAAPRVAEARAAFECVHLSTQPLAGADGAPARAFLVLGEVVGIHLDESILTDGHVDAEKTRLLARLGYRDYAVIAETFAMNRPGQT